MAWLTNYTYRKKVTLATSTYLSGDVTTDHVIMVVQDSGDTAFWSHVKTNGEDVRFTLADGETELKYYFEQFNHTTDDMVAHVKVTATFPSASTLDFYMYYGYGDATDGQDAVNTLTSYEAVYHCNETSGTTLDDATTSYDATASSDSIWTTTHKIGTGSLYPNETYYFTQGTLLDNTGTLAHIGISFWLKFDDTYDSDSTDYYIPFTKTNQSGKYVSLAFRADSGKLRPAWSTTGDTDNMFSTKASWTGGTWYHIFLTWNSTNGITLYVDGSQEAQDATVTTVLADGTTKDVYFCSNDDGTTQIFAGMMDEIKVLNTAITADEVALLYRSENEDLQSYGEEEVSGQTCTDAIALSDLKTLKGKKVISDAIALADVCDVGVPDKVLLDSIALAEAIEKVGTFKREFSEEISVNDSDFKQGSKVISGDALALADVVSKVIPAKEYSDVIALTDSVTKKVSLVLSDALALADAIDVGVPDKVLADVVSISDGSIKDSGKVLSDSIALAEAITKVGTFHLELSDALSLHDVCTKGAPAVELSDAIALADAVVRKTGKVLLDKRSFTGAIRDPNSDGATTEWTEVGPGSAHYPHVNNPTVRQPAVPSGTFTVQKLTSAVNGQEDIIGMTTPHTAHTVSEIKVWICARYVTDDANTIDVDLIVDGTPTGVQTVNTLTDSFAWYSKTFTDSWGEEEDTRQVSITSGISSGSVEVCSMYLELSGTYGTVHICPEGTGATLKEVMGPLVEHIALADSSDIEPSVNVSDTVSLTDSVTKSLSGKVLSDAISLTDSVQKGFPTLTLTDSVALADSTENIPGKILSDTISLAEDLIVKPSEIKDSAISLTDSLTKSLTGRVLTDSIALTDSAEPIASVILTDSVTLNDGTSKIPSVMLEDTISLTDGMVQTASVELSDNINLRDAMQGGTQVIISEVVSLSDTVLKSLSVIKSDSLSLTDSSNMKNAVTIVDALALKDSVLVGSGITISDIVSLSDEITKKASIILTDSITVVDSETHEWAKTIADVLTLVDSVDASITAKVLTDALSLSEVVAKKTSVSNADVFRLTDNISLTCSKVISDAIALADSIEVLPKKCLSDTITLNDSMNKDYALFKYCTGRTNNPTACIDLLKTKLDTLSTTYYIHYAQVVREAHTYNGVIIYGSPTT